MKTYVHALNDTVISVRRNFIYTTHNLETTEGLSMGEEKNQALVCSFTEQALSNTKEGTTANATVWVDLKIIVCMKKKKSKAVYFTLSFI